MLAVTATVFLLSLTGIPLTAGFQSKFFMLMAALRDGHQHWLVLFAILCAALSAYYYFKIIQAMFFKEASQDVDFIADGNEVTPPFKILLVVTAVLIVVIGIFPSIVTEWLHYSL